MSEGQFEKIRRKYPVLEKYVYLDTATTGLISKDSFNSMVSYLENRYREGMDIPDYVENWNYADNMRPLVARTINSEADEVFYGDNCSSILNVFSSGMDFSEGSNVISTDLSFPSTPYTWMNPARENVEIKLARSTNGQVRYDDIVALVDDRTVAVQLCGVENTSGFRHDLSRIGRFCREKDIFFVVDATQFIGALEVDVKEMNIDFLAASSYKWLNNVFGTGFGYASKGIIEKIEQQYVGWVGNAKRMDHSAFKLDLAFGARRYETGGLNWTGLRGMKEALEIYLALGKSETERYIKDLTEYLYQKVKNTENIGVVGPFDRVNMSGISYLTFPEKWNLNDHILRENGIRAHVAGKNTMRVSVHFYNNRQDIDRLFAFLKEYSD